MNASFIWQNSDTTNVACTVVPLLVTTLKTGYPL